MRALLLLLALAGCDATDPFRAEGKWRPAGVNELNLRVMLADPSHLDQGVEEPRRDGQLAAAAVDRLRPGLVRLGADPAAMSGVRLTRLPGAVRGSRRQRLLYLDPAAGSVPILQRPERPQTPGGPE